MNEVYRTQDSDDLSPAGKSQARPSVPPQLGEAGLHLSLSPEPSSKCTFKAKLGCLFILSPVIFQFPMALHFLLTPSGDLSTDPGLAASCSLGALRGWLGDLCLEMCFSSFSFPWINTEEEGAPSLRFLESKVK